MIDKASPEWAEKCKAFLEELAELSRKHGIILNSCGCCDSIWLSELPEAPGKYRHGCLDGYRGIDWEEGR